MSQSPNLATDMLIYAALETVDTHSWVIDTLSNHGVCDDHETETCLLYTSPSPRDATLSRMPSSA